MALGSWLWGSVAHTHGLSGSLTLAGLAMAISAVLAFRLPLARTERANLDPHGRWPDPEVHLALKPQSGMAELPSPRMRSPSQWPGTARSATSAGRWLIKISGVMKDLPWPRVRARGTRNARPVRRQAVK